MISILLLHPALPFPPKNGADQALLSSIVIAQRYYSVFLVFPVNNLDEYKKAEASFLAKYPNVKLYPYYQTEKRLKQPLPIRVWWSLSRLAEKYLHYSERISPKNPDKDDLGWVSLFQPQTTDFTKHINQVVEDNKVEIVQVEMPGLLSTILNLPDNVKRIFVHHELAFVRHALEKDIPNCSNHTQGLYQESQMLEISLLNNYDGVVTLSDVDKQKLTSAGVTSPIFSSFATVDVQPSKQIVFSNGLTLSFIGTCAHAPNYHGITWFLDECWPKLISTNPNYKLQIIGGWPEAIQKSFLEKYQNITFTGFVKNTEEYLQGTILIVPILIGSGIRMKILEGASIGVPIVTTSVGVEGIQITDGIHSSIADTAETFVERIIELRNHDLQKKYIDNFRNFVSDNYSIDALAENRGFIYKSILKNE